MSEFEPSVLKNNASPQCVESQEWTYGIDNTGTFYGDVATYELGLSDGTVLPFAQGGSSASWSEQLTEWAANIQTAADNAGLKWFVEPRYVDNPNPPNIDGTINGPGGTPSGLPGAPSSVIAQELIKQGMAWRYVNIQICPGQPVPVSAKRLTSERYGDEEYILSNAGPILGPIQKFWICPECGKEPVWYLADGVTPATAGQIPNCWEPCGVLSQLPAPPGRECDFQIAVACDDNNAESSVDYISGITRRASICNGQITFDYFQQDPDDSSALVPYELVGTFVNCVTGQPVPVEPPECNNFVLQNLYGLDGVFTGTLLNREWQGSQPNGSLISDPVLATIEGRRIRDAHDFSLAPDVTNQSSNLGLNDTNNTAAELSIQVKDGFVKLDNGGWFRYSGASEGYWAIELGKCCGPLEDVAEGGGFSPTRVLEFYLPKGIHQIRLWNVDTGGSNSSATFGYSPDGGITYVNDNTPPNIAFGSDKVSEVCITAKVCTDTGSVFNFITGELLNREDLYPCPIACEPCCSGGSTSPELPQTIGREA